MKLFKRIYYPVLCALLILALALGFADATYGGGGSKTFDGAWERINGHITAIASSSHNSQNAANMQEARNYIADVLSKSDLTQVSGESDEDGNFNVNFHTTGAKPQPSFTVQESTLTPETVQSIESLEKGTVVVAKTVHNIVAVIPGTDTLAGNKGDAVMLMAHYDSRPEGGGASDNAVAVASMLGVIDSVMTSMGEGDSPYKNDLVFVFTDAEEEHMYGAYAFKYQFKGFDNIYERVGLGANFDNLGNKGTLVMFQTSDNNSALIGQYSKINGGAFTSSIANFVYGMMSNFTDFEIYEDKTAVDFANVGGTDIYHTYLDSPENVKKGSVEQQYSMMERYATAFGAVDLDTLEGKDDAVYFSYLDMGVAHYPKAVSYVMGALILLLLAGAVTVNVLKRNKDKNSGFSMKKMGGGVAAQLLTVIATLAVSFAAYFLIALLLVGFGVLPIHAITSVRYASVGLVISAMIFTLAIAFGFYNLFKKLFAVKSADIARGTAFIWGILGAILSFAAPTLAYFFAITAIGETAVLLAVTLFKEKYREKTGDRLDSLFLYAVPLVFTLPMIIPVIMIAATVLNAIYLPVIMALFLLVAGFVAPYFTQLVPVLDGLAQKLPPRQIRFERTVVKDVEDRAKKGKFTKQEVKEVTKEPVPWRYKNYAGVSLLVTISVVMIILFSSFNAGFSSAVAGGYGYRNAIYNDSVVYVWTKTNSTVTRTIEVHDQLAYKYMRAALDSFDWNSEKNAYVKTDTANNVILSGQEPTITKSGEEYTFNTYGGARSEITITLSGAASVTSLTFKSGDNEYTVTNDGNETLNIHLPYGYGNTFSMKAEGANTLNIHYVEHRAGSDGNINNLREWNAVKTHIADKYPQLNGNLRAGIVLDYTLTL